MSKRFNDARDKLRADWSGEPRSPITQILNLIEDVDDRLRAIDARLVAIEQSLSKRPAA